MYLKTHLIEMAAKELTDEPISVRDNRTVHAMNPSPLAPRNAMRRPA